MDNTVIRIDIPAKHQHLNVLGACLNALLDRVDELSDREMLMYNMELAIHETCANIVDHAYGSQNGGRIRACLSVVDHPRRQLVVDLHDSGRAFEINDVREPNLEGAQIHGYGLYLMRQLLDEVVYTPNQGNNHWRLVKNL